MFHAFGNNPVKYTDPDGSDIKSVAIAFGKGMWDAAVDDVKGIVNTVAHPIQTAKNIYNGIKNEVTELIADAPAYFENKVNAVKDGFNDFIEATNEERAYVIGGITENVVVTVTTAKAVKTKTKGATGTIQTPNQIGKAGESAVKSVYDIGGKSRISVNGRTRIPDGLKPGVLSEVKNTKRQAFTTQLHDFLDYAEANNMSMDLYTRPDTILTRPLQEAIEAGRINLKIIPE